VLKTETGNSKRTGIAEETNDFLPYKRGHPVERRDHSARRQE
jgi:hypothetical protein